MSREMVTINCADGKVVSDAVRQPYQHLKYFKTFSQVQKVTNPRSEIQNLNLYKKVPLTVHTINLDSPTSSSSLGSRGEEATAVTLRDHLSERLLSSCRSHHAWQCSLKAKCTFQFNLTWGKWSILLSVYINILYTLHPWYIQKK